MRILTNRRYSLFVIIVLVAMCWATVKAPTARAYQNNNLPAGNIPNYIFAPQSWNGTVSTPNYLGRCTDSAGNNWSVAQNSWISSDNGTNFTATSKVVPYGTTSVAAYVVLEDSLCYDNGSQFQVIDTWHRISSVTANNGATVSGVANNTIANVGYPAVANKNAYVAVNALPITVNIPANLPAGSYSFSVTLNNVARINLFRNGVQQCVQSGGNRPGHTLADFVGCAQASASIPFIITVESPSPRGNVDIINCSSIQGWAYDPDSPSQSTDIHIYVNGPSGSGTGYNIGPTNVYRPDVNAAFGITGNHGFSWSVPAIYLDNAPHSVYIYAINIGPPAGNPLIGSGTIGPCVPPPPPKKPYLSVYGGDVQAGSGFGEGCTASNGSAKIMTFNQGTGNYLGAGTHMAAFALGVITEFASAGGGAGSGPKTLSFSNTAAGTYGGNFGHTYCASNYWAGAPATFTAPNLASPIAEGEHRVVYFNGNVTISSNIAYANDGAWADLSKIPSFYLIVKGGDIYIDKSVTQLDGVYVAMKNGAVGGTIYTCTNGSTKYSGTVPTGATGCGNKLTINGAFIANQVKFLRTNGDIATAVAGEPATSANIAETFIYGPEIWAR